MSVWWWLAPPLVLLALGWAWGLVIGVIILAIAIKGRLSR